MWFEKEIELGIGWPKHDGIDLKPDLEKMELEIVGNSTADPRTEVTGVKTKAYHGKLTGLKPR